MINAYLINIRILVRIIPIILLGMFLSSCQSVQSEVSSFSVITQITQGEPFFVLPNDKQSSSAEFTQYANSISRRLERKGWYRVYEPNKAKYVVLIDYGVAGSQTGIASMPVYGQTGGGTTSYSGTFNTYGSNYGNSYGTYSGSAYTMPTWGVVGSQTYSYTYYQRYFQLRVIDTITDTAVYETKAASDGSSSTFGAVAECIFDMALADFPLQSNSKTSVLMDKCGQ